MKNTVKNMVLETIEGLYRAGTVTELTLKEVNALALPEIKPYAPKAIISLRRKLRLSQAALARFINTSVSTIQKWEQGTKKPSGPALKLLHIIYEKGLSGVV